MPRYDRPRPPAWLGIGAQRSGTTWFSDLLLQHPEVCLSNERSGAIPSKELHFFDTACFDGWPAGMTARYRDMFRSADASKPGEFTPAYLRCSWAPALARAACSDETIIVVLLRDPIERFRSALRWYITQPDLADLEHGPLREIKSREKGTDAVWGGMYATHLRAWASVFPRRQFVVQQYEKVRLEPQGAVERVWSAMGLSPVKLTDVDSASVTTSNNSAAPWEDLPGLDECLMETYRTEVDVLESEWGIDRSLWPNFS